MNLRRHNYFKAPNDNLSWHYSHLSLLLVVKNKRRWLYSQVMTSFFKFVIYPLVHSHLLDTYVTLYLELLPTTQNYMLPNEEIACNKFFSKK